MTKDYYIIAIDEKDKIKWHETGCMMKNHIELFHIKAKSFKDAISIVKEKTSKRFLKSITPYLMELITEVK